MPSGVTNSHFSDLNSKKGDNKMRRYMEESGKDSGNGGIETHQI